MEVILTKLLNQGEFASSIAMIICSYIAINHFLPATPTKGSIIPLVEFSML